MHSSIWMWQFWNKFNISIIGCGYCFEYDKIFPLCILIETSFLPVHFVVPEIYSIPLGWLNSGVAVTHVSKTTTHFWLVKGHIMRFQIVHRKMIKDHSNFKELRNEFQNFLLVWQDNCFKTQKAEVKIKILVEKSSSIVLLLSETTYFETLRLLFLLGSSGWVFAYKSGNSIIMATGTFRNVKSPSLCHIIYERVSYKKWQKKFLISSLSL